MIAVTPTYEEGVVNAGRPGTCQGYRGRMGSFGAAHHDVQARKAQANSA